MIKLHDKFTIAVLVGILIVPLLAFMDKLGLRMFNTVGGFGSVTELTMQSTYMDLFWIFAYALILLVGICYYFFYKKDKSETLAVVFTPIILVWSGFEDLLFYVFTGTPFKGTMPWLDSHFFMRLFTSDGHVTASSLVTSMFSGVLILTIILVFLKKARW